MFKQNTQGRMRRQTNRNGIFCTHAQETDDDDDKRRRLQFDWNSTFGSEQLCNIGAATDKQKQQQNKNNVN